MAKAPFPPVNMAPGDVGAEMQPQLPAGLAPKKKFPMKKKKAGGKAKGKASRFAKVFG